MLDEQIPYQKPNLRIADISCGTGIWLLDLLPSCHPTTEFFALDLNTAQLPPDPWLPPSITPIQFNLYDDDLPDGLHEASFNIINISIVFSFVKDDRIEKVFRNITRLLKPGGYLQWTELDGYNAECISPRPQYRASAVPHFAKELWTLIGETCCSWPSRLDEIMAKQGLHDTICRRPPPKQDKLKIWMQDFLMVHKEISDLFAVTSASCEQSQYAVRVYRELLDEARKETQRAGIALWMPVIRAVGRK